MSSSSSPSPLSSSPSFWPQLRRFLTDVSVRPPLTAAEVESVVKAVQRSHYALLAQLSLDDVEALAQRIDRDVGRRGGDHRGDSSEATPLPSSAQSPRSIMDVD